MIGIIRTQNKIGIHAVTSVWINQNKIMGETTPNGPDDTGWILGDSPLAEAALAELDRIEQWIADGAQGVYQVREGQVMPTDKERFLAVATPDEWREWLNNRRVFETVKYGGKPTCLFCLAFGGNPSHKEGSSCYSCMPGKSDGKYWPCNKIKNRQDAALARLERAGIWED